LSYFVRGTSFPVFSLVFDDLAAGIFELLDEMMPAPWYTPDMSISTSTVSNQGDFEFHVEIED
jgi:hypothetical protein